MQHLISNYREEDVVDEAEAEDLLHARAENSDVGSPADRRTASRMSVYGLIWAPPVLQVDVLVITTRI